MVKILETSELPVADLSVSEANARASDPGKLDELIASIRTLGVLQPILVDDQWKVIDGQRRLLAAMSVGLEKIPCIIAKFDTGEDIEASIAANVVRQAMSTRVTAKACRALMSRLGFTEAGLLEALSKKKVRDDILKHNLVRTAATAMAVLPSVIVGLAGVGGLDDIWWDAYEKDDIDTEALELLPTISDAQREKLAEHLKKKNSERLVGWHIRQIIAGMTTINPTVDNAIFKGATKLEAVSFGNLLDALVDQDLIDEFDDEDEAQYQKHRRRQERPMLTEAGKLEFLKLQYGELTRVANSIHALGYDVTLVGNAENARPIAHHDAKGTFMADLEIEGPKGVEAVVGTIAKETEDKAYEQDRTTFLVGMRQDGQAIVRRCRLAKPAEPSADGGGPTITTEPAVIADVPKKLMLTKDQIAELVAFMGRKLHVAIDQDPVPAVAWMASAYIAQAKEKGTTRLQLSTIYGYEREWSRYLPAVALSAKELKQNQTMAMAALVIMKLQTIRFANDDGWTDLGRDLLRLYDLSPAVHFEPSDEWIGGFTKPQLVDMIHTIRKPKKGVPVALATSAKPTLIKKLREVLGPQLATWFPDVKDLEGWTKLKAPKPTGRKKVDDGEDGADADTTAAEREAGASAAAQPDDAPVDGGRSAEGNGDEGEWG